MAVTVEKGTQFFIASSNPEIVEIIGASIFAGAEGEFNITPITSKDSALLYANETSSLPPGVVIGLNGLNDNLVHEINDLIGPDNQLIKLAEGFEARTLINQIRNITSNLDEVDFPPASPNPLPKTITQEVLTSYMSTVPHKPEEMTFNAPIKPRHKVRDAANKLVDWLKKL